MRRFSKVVIANRGEIAVRLIRACREAGLRSVAVYSEADRGALHVRLADEAWEIGPAEARDSYLSAERILEAARRSGAEAIHPGYGFLSESADFAAEVEGRGLVFVGPPVAALRAMGDKAAARRAALAAGVPVVPGYEGPPGRAPSDGELRAAARSLGYPLLVKASAGGGGRGMRVVREAGELEPALAAARREAAGAFGSDALLLERYVGRARHVEFQILGDGEGRLLHLLERECSAQRRHQKLVEESPSPLLDEELRGRMGRAAVAVARAAGYANAGTAEFVVDPETREFYFLEMNARLQVEHPVTELLTGLDLVRWQLRIAAGESLPFVQEDIRPRGHVIECRLCAEDPRQAFLPSGGTILRYREAAGPGLRVDSGYEEGDRVSGHYDSLLAKLVAQAEDRPSALARMRRALEDTRLLGLATNREFLLWLLDTEDFRQGRVHTTWIEEGLGEWAASRVEPGPELLALAAFLLAGPAEPGPGGAAGAKGVRPPADPFSPWALADTFRAGAPR